MSAIASQITGVTSVNSTVCPGAHQIKYQSSASLALVRGEFPAHRTSNAENVFIWLRQHLQASAALSVTSMGKYSLFCKIKFTSYVEIPKHWDRNKLTVILQTTFSIAFPRLKSFEFLDQVSLKYIPQGLIRYIQHWFRWWFGAEQAISHYLNHWWCRLLTNIGLNEPYNTRQVVWL